MTVRTVSISPLRTSASRLRASSRPGMSRIVAHARRPCHPARRAGLRASNDRGVDALRFRQLRVRRRHPVDRLSGLLRERRGRQRRGARLGALGAASRSGAPGASWGCFVAAAVLFAVFAIPSFVILPADARHPLRLASAAARGVGETLTTLREILRDPARAQMRRFLTAYLVYEDGVNTVVTFAGVFASKTP